jgi:hypothetical protein
MIFTKEFPPYISLNKKYEILEKTRDGFRFIADTNGVETVSKENVTKNGSWGYIKNEIILSPNIKIL